MTNVSEWSVTAGLNNSSPPDGWPEGMARSAVNDAAREMMAALAKWYKDSNGSLVTAGTSNAYTLTTNNGYTALNDIPVLVFRADRANTGAATLQVDGLTAKNLKAVGGVSSLGSGAIAINQLVVAAYNSQLDVFEGVNLGTNVDVGTRMLFQQSAAPTGWTKDTSSHNDKALRLVTGSAGSGGTYSFSSTFTTITVARANLPAFTMSLAGGQVISGGSVNTVQQGSAGSFSTITNPVLASGSCSTGGSGTPLDFTVQYADAIIASKA